MADLKQFLELFNPLPGNKYLQVTTFADETTTALYEMLQNVDGELNLAVYDENAKELSPDFSNIKVQYIKNFKHPFRAVPRDYDIVIFKDIFHLHSNPKAILKLAYTTLANTAHIIIMQEKGTMNIEAMKTLLQEHEFRAPNAIDVLAEYDLVMAKKMHMWGAGL